MTHDDRIRHEPSPGSRPVPRRLLAFDVGGANLKAADGCGDVHCEPFELWRRPGDLAARLTAIAAPRRPERIVATMTGEIADCCPDRRSGVAAIVAALSRAADAVNADLGIYRLDGLVVPAEEAVRAPLSVAASNWHALARLAATHAARDRALLVDVGSTTTDVVLLDRHGPVPIALDDAGRLASGELVYTGVERTPVAALVRSLPMGTGRRRVATELFARAQDVWMLLGGIPEDPGSHDTADGGPATRAAARVRLARMMLLEPATIGEADAVVAARHVAAVQARLVARAVRSVLRAHPRPPERVVVTGHGGALAAAALDVVVPRLPRVHLDAILGAAAARAAPAVALALLAKGEIG